MRFRVVLALLVVVFCVGAAQFCWVWFFFRGVEDRTTGESAGSLTSKPTMELPAAPRLGQLDRLASVNAADSPAQEAAKQRMLATYGTTEAEGFIHIPIERAMDLVISQLPVREQSSEGVPIKDRGLVDSGESNSGRMFREGSR